MLGRPFLALTTFLIIDIVAKIINLFVFINIVGNTRGRFSSAFLFYNIVRYIETFFASCSPENNPFRFNLMSLSVGILPTPLVDSNPWAINNIVARCGVLEKCRPQA